MEFFGDFYEFFEMFKSSMFSNAISHCKLEFFDSWGFDALSKCFEDLRSNNAWKQSFMWLIEYVGEKRAKIQNPVKLLAR